MSGVDSSGAALRVSGYVRSDRGRVREENQDRALVLDLAPGGCEVTTSGAADDASARFDFELSPGGAILFVADGMGGQLGGSRASELAVASVRDALTNGAASGSSGFAAALGDALVQANAAIHRASGQEGGHRGMGTTGTLAGIRGGWVYLAQIGDSRAYLVRGRSVVQLTRDQSLVQDLIDSGMMSEEDARNVNDNTILQALGPTRDVRPALTYHPLRREDAILVCSDGLFRVVEDGEIRDVVQREADPERAGEALVGLANRRGGPDNVTVVIARVGGGGWPEVRADDALGRRAYEGEPV